MPVYKWWCLGLRSPSRHWWLSLLSHQSAGDSGYSTVGGCWRVPASALTVAPLPLHLTRPHQPRVDTEPGLGTSSPHLTSAIPNQQQPQDAEKATCWAWSWCQVQVQLVLVHTWDEKAEPWIVMPGWDGWPAPDWWVGLCVGGNMRFARLITDISVCSPHCYWLNPAGPWLYDNTGTGHVLTRGTGEADQDTCHVTRVTTSVMVMDTMYNWQLMWNVMLCWYLINSIHSILLLQSHDGRPWIFNTTPWIFLNLNCHISVTYFHACVKKQSSAWPELTVHRLPSSKKLSGWWWWWWCMFRAPLSAHILISCFTQPPRVFSQ